MHWEKCITKSGRDLTYCGRNKIVLRCFYFRSLSLEIIWVERQSNQQALRSYIILEKSNYLNPVLVWGGTERSFAVSRLLPYIRGFNLVPLTALAVRKDGRLSISAFLPHPQTLGPKRWKKLKNEKHQRVKSEKVPLDSQFDKEHRYCRM
jgi:hypothetical protein